MTGSSEGDTRGRVWASKWYRIRPSTFEQYELFFDPDRIYAVYADESFKSLLLRRDGREGEAAALGERMRDAPAAELLDNDRSFAIDAGDVERIDLRGGSLLFKPRLTITTDPRTYEFYHPSRREDTAALAERLTTRYPAIPVAERNAPLSW